MNTLITIAGLTLSFVVMLVIALKIHSINTEEGRSEKEVDRDIENLSQNINQEIKNLEKEIEEFEI